VHVEESDTHLIVQAELPGLNENEITVNIEKDVLTISGERKVEKKDEKKGYYYSEIQFGKFERKMRLPEYVDSEKTEAEYRNGVLNIKLEKKPESAPKKIEVKSGQ
jgi:HSP20 family protein